MQNSIDSREWSVYNGAYIALRFPELVCYPNSPLGYAEVEWIADAQPR